MKVILIVLIISSLVLLVGCSTDSKTDIKDDFCGIHINYQYCKCAFHNQYCNDIGMNKIEAKNFVYAEYDKWIDSLVPIKPEDEKYGIIEKDSNLYLNSKPDEVLEIKTKDLPKWAQGQIATIGATIITAGPPDKIVEGDSHVLLNGLPIARINDKTAHGGSIVEGSKNIFVNGIAVAIIGGEAVDPMVTGTVPNVGGPIVANVN